MKRYVCFLLILVLCFPIAGCNNANKKESTQFPGNWQTMQPLILKPMDEIMDTLHIADDQLEEYTPMHVRVLNYYVEYAGSQFELELNPSVMPDEEHRGKYTQYDYSELPAPAYPDEEFLLTFRYKANCEKLEDALLLMERVVSNYTELLGKPDSGNYLEKDPQKYFKEAEGMGIGGGPYELKVVWDCTPDDINSLEYTTVISFAQVYDETSGDIIGYLVDLAFGCHMKPIVG